MTEDSSRSDPLHWDRLTSDLHASCRVFEVRKERFRHSGSKREGDFFVISSSPWANICALTPQRELIMVKQFRFGRRDFFWEFPGGIVENGEDPVAAAVRELREETGYAGQNPRVIGRVHPNPAIQNNTCTLVRVDEAVLCGSRRLDENEEILVRPVPIAQVSEWAFQGKITHSIALNQVLFLLQSLRDEE